MWPTYVVINTTVNNSICQNRIRGALLPIGMWYHRGVSIERINPAELAKPSGFTHAVAATGSRLVFLAGQTAQGTDGRIADRGVVAQFEQALTNLLTVLRAAGGGPSDLASMTAYIVDVDDYRAHAREIGEVWRRLAGRDYPAMAAVGVQRLWDPAALIELQAVAAVAEPS